MNMEWGFQVGAPFPLEADPGYLLTITLCTEVLCARKCACQELTTVVFIIFLRVAVLLLDIPSTVESASCQKGVEIMS